MVDDKRQVGASPSSSEGASSFVVTPQMVEAASAVLLTCLWGEVAPHAAREIAEEMLIAAFSTSPSGQPK